MGWRRLHRQPENFLRPVTIPAHHHRPNDAGGLVGACDRSNFGRFARQQSANPLAIAGWSITGMTQHRNRGAEPPRRHNQIENRRRNYWSSDADKGDLEWQAATARLLDVVSDTVSISSAS